MKIFTFEVSFRYFDDAMSKHLERIIGDGMMIIDYGIEVGNNNTYGYVKYCDKQFLRDYKIDSIMGEI